MRMMFNISLLVSVLVICLISLQADDSSTTIDCSGSDLHSVVLKYDIDKSGEIDSDELLMMTMDMGIAMLAEEATGVVSKYGSNGEMTDSDLCNYLNTLANSDSTLSEEIQQFIASVVVAPVVVTPSSSSSATRMSAKKSAQIKSSIDYGKTSNPTPTPRTNNPTPSKFHPTMTPTEEPSEEAEAVHAANRNSVKASLRAQ